MLVTGLAYELYDVCASSTSVLLVSIYFGGVYKLNVHHRIIVQ